MEPAQKSDFSQPRREYTHRHLSPTDMLRLFFLWLSGALRASAFATDKSRYCAQLLVSDNFLPKGPKELLWLV